MSVENLTRYTVFHNEHCDYNCGLMPQHDGPLVKFEEAMDTFSNSLKAEIAAIKSCAEDRRKFTTLDDSFILTEVLRQLSAVVKN